MASTVDRFRDWWEVKTPRERSLVLLLGGFLIFAIVFGVALSVRGGISEIADSNAEKREALDSVRLYQLSAAGRSTKSQVKFTDVAVDLDSYVNNIVQELSLKSPTYPTPKTTEKGAYTEVSMEIRINQELTVAQVTELLEKIETKDKRVFVSEVEIRNRSGKEDKLSLNMTVVTFKKAKKTEGAEDA